MNLDKRTRGYMLEELDYDIERGTLYEGKRLTEEGIRRYPELLRRAIIEGDDSTLATDLGSPGLLATHEISHSSKGKAYEKAVRFDANEVLAEGEFNRFYLRGLSRRAIDDDINSLTVYRAKEVAVARSASVGMIGTAVDPVNLLNDLRERPGVDTALGLPPGPSSGLSAHLP